MNLIYGDVSGCVGYVKSYRVNVRRLCLIICSVAEEYYKENRDKFNFFNFSAINWDEEVEKMKGRRN